MPNVNTVADLAVAMPAAIPVLEKFKIDYCCHGNQPIEQACSRAGITTDQLLGLIEKEPAAAETRSWDGVPLMDIVHFVITKHHAYTRTTLETLAQLGAKVAEKHGPRHPELIAVKRLLGQLTDDLIPHMIKEEQILFPYFDALAASNGNVPIPFFGTVRNPIRLMMVEHEAAGENMAEIRAAANDFDLPADACTSFTAFYKLLGQLEDDLHRHIHLENNILFPQAVAIEASAVEAAV